MIKITKMYHRLLSNNYRIIRQSQNNVMTWSHLANAFNSKPTHKFKPFSQDNVGLFNLPELRTFEGYYQLKENVQNQTANLIREATSSTRNRKLVEIFDELSNSLCKVADLAEFIRIAHPHSAHIKAAEDACISVSEIVEKLNTHKELYEVLKGAVINGDTFETSEIDEHVAKLFLFDFEQSGIHLEEMQRLKIVQLNNNILQLGQRFMSGAVNPRQIPKSILPDSLKQYFVTVDDKIVVSGLYADSGNVLAREVAYKLYLHPDNHQEYLLSELIKCRSELAKICGFSSYAERAIKSSTAESPEVVRNFLDMLTTELRPMAENDFKIMSNMKKSELGLDNPLAPWDTPYYTAKLKKQCLQVSAADFTPYFSLGGCMEGLNFLFHSLYGVKLENAEILPGECWTSNIYKLRVVHETEGELGYIYCDFFDRPNKPNQDCHFTIQGGKLLDDGTYQNPIVVVMLNLNSPRWSGPTLLTPAMVDNLFHEMGHAMHSMFARTKYQHITGTRCCTDFAEVPSILMEYFASDPRIIRNFAKHFQTHESIPDEMLQRLCLSKHLFAASEMQLQVFYSVLDQEYHNDKISESEESTTEILKRIQKDYYTLPYVEQTAWQLRFSHLVGYGAKYYSYLISRAIASWIWYTYFAEDPLSRSAGERFRRDCLSHGGGMPSRQLVNNYLQRSITPKNLAHSLINELELNNGKISELSSAFGLK